MPRSPVRRFLIVLGVVLAGLAVIYGLGFALFVHALTRSDPYPTFMTDYQSSGPRTYDQAERRFSEFVVEAFPVGSNAKDAVARMTAAGFDVSTSSSDSVELRWRRHAGTCTEWYSIVVRQNADGTDRKSV